MMFAMNDVGEISAIWVSVKLAVVTTLVLLAICTPLAWFLSRSKTKLRFLPEALFSLPLVLPPTVLGFYLLIFLGPDGPLGAVYSLLGTRSLVFTFWGLVFGSVIYSFPFVFQPLVNAFDGIDNELLDSAATLGASPIDRFVSIVLPATRSSFVTASVLGFAHTIGEFGVVLMIGGSVQGETRTASIAIYENVEKGSYPEAFSLSLVLIAASFVALALVFYFDKRRQQK